MSGPGSPAVALTDVPEICLDGGEISIQQIRFRNDDHVPARSGGLVSAKDLSNQSFSSVSLNRAPQSARGDDPEATPIEPVGQEQGRHEPPGGPQPLLVDALELGAATNPFPGGKSCRSVRLHHEPVRRRELQGQALTSLRAAPLQHQPAVLRTHTHQEPVGSFPAPVVGLIRPFHRFNPREAPPGGPLLSCSLTVQAPAPQGSGRLTIQRP